MPFRGVLVAHWEYPYFRTPEFAGETHWQLRFPNRGWDREVLVPMRRERGHEEFLLCVEGIGSPEPDERSRMGRPILRVLEVSEWSEVQSEDDCIAPAD